MTVGPENPLAAGYFNLFTNGQVTQSFEINPAVVGESPYGTIVELLNFPGPGVTPRQVAPQIQPAALGADARVIGALTGGTDLSGDQKVRPGEAGVVTTMGICQVLIDASVVAGQALILSPATAGTCRSSASPTTRTLGICLETVTFSMGTDLAWAYVDPGTEGGSGGGGASFPTFTAAGSPEGVQSATAGQTYQDSTTGALYIHPDAGPSTTGWVILGGAASDINSTAGLGTVPGTPDGMALFSPGAISITSGGQLQLAGTTILDLEVANALLALQAASPLVIRADTGEPIQFSSPPVLSVLTTGNPGNTPSGVNAVQGMMMADPTNSALWICTTSYNPVGPVNAVWAELVGLAVPPANGLVPVALQTTGPVNALANQFIPVDVTGGPITVNLPTAPPDKTRVGVKLIRGQTATNVVTYQCGGTDTLNATVANGGVTSGQLILKSQSETMQYQASTGIWYLQAGDTPVGQLDLRYANLVSPHLTGVPTAPTGTTGDSSTQIATDAFVTTAVNNAISGVNPAIAVSAATTAAADTSAWTYNNGAAGVGATFTGPVNTPITIDGFTFTAITSQSLLVKDDTQAPSGAFNGIYVLTALQTVGTGAVFTRRLDYDTPSDMNNTGAIPVVSGTANGTTSWVLTSNVATVGTSPLTFTKFTLNPATIAPLASPTFTGVPAAPTAAKGTSTTQIATTAFVAAAVVPSAALVVYQLQNFVN